MSVYVGMYGRISRKRQDRTSRQFLQILPVAVARSSYDDNAMNYVTYISGFVIYVTFAHNGLYGAWLGGRTVKVTHRGATRGS